MCLGGISLKGDRHERRSVILVLTLACHTLAAVAQVAPPATAGQGTTHLRHGPGIVLPRWIDRVLADRHIS